jgi:hypothetical protein
MASYRSDDGMDRCGYPASVAFRRNLVRQFRIKFTDPRLHLYARIRLLYPLSFAGTCSSRADPVI